MLGISIFFKFVITNFSARYTKLIPTPTVPVQFSSQDMQNTLIALANTKRGKIK